MIDNTPGLACATAFFEKIRNSYEEIDAHLVMGAYTFSEARLADRRGGGATYIQAGELLLEQEADAVTVACALLAPLLWNGLATEDEIRESFGDEVTAALAHLGSPFLMRIDSESHRREDIHALLESLSGLPERAILLIAFRLLELESMLDSDDAVPHQMAQETLDFYVPIANRLSLGQLRKRLEDVCFRILDPAGYEALQARVAPIQREDERCLEVLIEGVRRLIAKNNIQGRIEGRTKSLYSIRRKMVQTGKDLEEIMDRVGLRVVVGSVPECYAVLGLLHSHFKPIPGTFDDYIGLPKDNGYQSLHTCVYPVREISHKPIEIQVRTELMHKEAEYGAAAHWRYKSGIPSVNTDYTMSQWMEGLVRQHDNSNSSEDFIELLHRQVFEDHLVVFGKGGKIVRLCEDATVKDYLEKFNMNVAPNMIVKVNGQIASMDQPLRDGDSIDLMEADKGFPPTVSHKA